MKRLALLLSLLSGAANAATCFNSSTDHRCGPFDYNMTIDAGYYGPDHSTVSGNNQSNNAYDKCVPVPKGSATWTGPYPVVLIVHGGGWTAGNKSFGNYECGSWASNGYIAIQINYRLSGSTPKPMVDTQLAVRYIRANATALNALQNVTAKGDSAGGTLVMQSGFYPGNYPYAGDAAPTLLTGYSSKANQVIDEFGPYTFSGSGPTLSSFLAANVNANVPVFAVQGIFDGPPVAPSETKSVVNVLTAAQKSVYYYSYWGYHEYSQDNINCTTNCDPTLKQTSAAYHTYLVVAARTAYEMWLGSILNLQGIPVSKPSTGSAGPIP